jgi:hypothetical protein
MMEFEGYIGIFREECGEHLPESEVRELEPLFSGKDARRIFLKLEELRTAGRVPSPRFAKALTDFFWRFAY